MKGTGQSVVVFHFLEEGASGLEKDIPKWGVIKCVLGGSRFEYLF